MNLFAWKGEPLKALNNSMFVTDGASVGEHAQLEMTDGSCQNKKAEPHYAYRNRIRGNSATPTSLLSQLRKFGSRRYDYEFSTSGCVPAV